MLQNTNFLFVGSINAMHPWLLSLLVFVSILAVSEAGFRRGRRSGVRMQEETRKRISSVGDAVLAMLGLLLAFSLVMSVARFDNRRNLMLEEANAISTSSLRSQLVLPPEGPAVAGLLRKYVDAKLHYFDAGIDFNHLVASRGRTARIQNELWAHATAAAQKNPGSIPAGLLLQSLNQTFDLENARWTALTIRLPNGVIGVDVLVAMVAGLLVGYNFGIAGNRHLMSWFLLAICITAVLAVIADLDQPHRDLIRVSQQPLLDLQRQLEEDH